MNEQSIANRVKDLLIIAEEGKTEEIRMFFEQMQLNLTNACRAVLRKFFYIILAWAVAYSIGVGLIEEGQVAGFKVSAVRSLLLIAPPLNGILYYLFMACFTSMIILRETLHCYYRHLLPEVHRLNMEYLMEPPSFVSIEEFLALNKSKGILALTNKISSYFIVALLLIAGFACFIHVSLLARSATDSNWTIGFVIILGIIPVLRSFFLMYSIREVTSS